MSERNFRMYIHLKIRIAKIIAIAVQPLSEHDDETRMQGTVDGIVYEGFNGADGDVMKA